jgi:hypothetical protein
VRIAGSVLVGIFWKIHFQGLPSSFHTRKRCSSSSSHGIFFLVFERSCSSSLEQPSSSLLGSGSQSLKLASSLIAAELSRDVTTRPALPCRTWVRVAWLLGVGSSACGGRAVAPPGEGQDEVCLPTPIKRNESGCSGLIVKSSSFPTYPCPE